MTKTKNSQGSHSRRRPASEPAVTPIGDFSRPILIEDIPETGLDVSIEADASEREAIARANGLVAVADLKASFKVTKLDDAAFNVKGVLTADITQTCVVSLDQFSSKVASDIDVDFAPAGPGVGEALEGPDPIVDGRIDLGALAEEFLILSLDPYPRKPGVRFDESVLGAEAVAPVSAFEALKKLKGEK